ncbi:DNA repair protein RecN [Thioalkalivibrio sulfidiphilus]|uniref:DNA repair protein RecN n=1 Tax=Thioalkalivibrio sulfidiphilus (strain HL-EbGR7) TaxID=396588 RepID=B8GNW7_THISH|nr:DNA repair protein RecN [Thioalkalivibrio sulfidiphilus]ACL72056.1 DNA repair protein RecN [Thioalkalivibrio sulfidiphilus HL-EbGr7]
MITSIHIRDFAIIDELSLELGSGMSALTGETGAGKSILVDALGLALGDRADSTAVRAGAERAEISVGFDLSDDADALIWLQEQALETGHDCLLRRVVGADGKSRAWINGTPTTLQNLKTLGEMLVDIHGQHAHQSLTRREVQRRILDEFADHPKLLDEARSHFQAWREIQERLDRAAGDDEARSARRDLLRFQTGELKALELGDDEVAQLDEEHRRLAHAGRLLEVAESVHQGLYADDQSVDTQLGQLHHLLEEVTRLDPSLKEPLELIASAQIQIREAADALRHYADRVELDPGRLSFVEQRLSDIHDLARKHRVPPEDLPRLARELLEELAQLESDDEDLDALSRKAEAAETKYRDAAAALSRSRQAAAKKLGKQVSEAMQGLGMEGGKFQVAVDSDPETRPAAHGLDRIEFLVTANPGQPLQALTRVASGGELSRISLAIQMIAAKALPIPTLIFDEVDSGIGGAVAEVVGRQLRSLGEHRQVLCVTHLPQVAAQAHHHLQVSKHKGKADTRTRIQVLDADSRIQEVARMLGGVDLTEQTVAHAREMVEKAKDNSRFNIQGSKG